ncbi:MAG: S41 family peptidase [Leptospiraceae bacterium]|nr:S41 family peptidase [Leptospiraceae bacterium]MDW8306848.1 S41 family peptidase [Leptospiraceae bacterium]
MNLRHKRNLLGLGVGLLLFFIGTYGSLATGSKEEISEEGLQELFNMVRYQLRNEYVDPISNQEIMFGAIRGMLQALDDPHTRFMTPDEYNELQVETRGNFGGLGIEVSIRDNVLTVISPIEDTPAYRAGIKPNDKIIEINKRPTRDMTLTEAVKLLRGTPGTSVNISVVREGEDEVLYFDIVREIIKIQVVNSEILEGNIGYVRLKQFSNTAPDDLKKVLQNLLNKKVKGIILDLRWNPGGLLDAAVKVANFFIKEGEIVSTRGRRSELDRVFRANPRDAIVPDLPLIVLANEGSASASEIVTGAVKDHKRGLFIGTKTFGKGSVQNVIPLMYNTAMAITIQKYYTPAGHSIHKTGIKPDIEVQPLDFTREDRRHYREIREKNIVQDFVKQHPLYNNESIAKFKKLIESKGLGLSDYALRRTLREEYDKNKMRPVVDLEFDVQLQRAISEMKKRIS